MNLTWYMRRLARMSPGEVKGRLGDSWTKRRWRSRQIRPGQEDPLPLPASVAPFPTPLRDFDPDSLSEDGRARLLRAADAALAGRFHFFDREHDNLTRDPDWFLDIRTGRRAPEDTYAFDIDHRNVEQVGTIKYVWEPSRHYQLTVLSAAYLLTSDDRYAAFVADQLRSWWRNNPFLSGVHWTSGIELGCRLISWVWIRRLLDGWPRVQELFEDNPEFLRQLHHHQDYLAALPSHGSSANNHVIAEEAGQFAASCAFPFFPESASWREHSATALRREAELQTFASGINKELASSYHVFVLELFLAAAVEGEAAGTPLGSPFWHCICAMTDALAAMIDVRRRPPRQGDGDEGRGLMLDDPNANPCPSLLTTGAAIFGSLDWWPETGPDDLRTLLWRNLIDGPMPSGTRPDAMPHRFADAGMVILRDNSHSDDEIWCRCDEGPHGFLSIAAHAHADALSVELRCGGVEILVDPGTYTYQGEAEWRSYFRSTIGHNCLELGGEDQSQPGGPFMWLESTDGEAIATAGLQDGDEAVWTAAHRGYGRLTPSARHQRSVKLVRGDGRMVIEDIVESSGNLDCRLAFHLGPEVDCFLDGNVAQLRWQTADGTRRATMQLPVSLEWSTVRGQTEPPLGWYSPCFGAKMPITTLIGKGQTGGGDSLITDIKIDLKDRSASRASADEAEASTVS